MVQIFKLQLNEFIRDGKTVAELMNLGKQLLGKIKNRLKILQIEIRWVTTIPSSFHFDGSVLHHSVSISATIIISNKCPVIVKWVMVIVMMQKVTIVTKYNLLKTPFIYASVITTEK